VATVDCRDLNNYSTSHFLLTWGYDSCPGLGGYETFMRKAELQINTGVVTGITVDVLHCGGAFTLRGVCCPYTP
jgi:hypothetical protein